MIVDVDYTQAVCATAEDPAVFFPDGGANHHRMTADAKALCSGCPVISACLAHALKHEDSGIWGGRTPAERDTLRRKMRIRFEPYGPPLTR